MAFISNALQRIHAAWMSATLAQGYPVRRDGRAEKQANLWLMPRSAPTLMEALFASSRVQFTPAAGTRMVA